MADRFIHSILAQNQAQLVDADVVIDLPVNPLSALYLNLSPLNETSVITAYSSLQTLLAAVTAIRVTWRGSSLLDLSGQDLAAYLWMVMAIDVMGSNTVETDNVRRSIILPIPFGRSVWNPDEAIPTTKKGELQLQLTFNVAGAGFDGLRFSIESLELPDAAPTHFQRITTQAITFAATGNNDVDLPIGNIIRGILAFGATGFAGTTPAPTLGALRLLFDNVENGYSSTDFEVSRAIISALGRHPPHLTDHFHSVNAAGVGREDTESQQITAAIHELYTYLDYDATRDDRYSLETAGASRIHLRINAEAANAARFLPVEKVLVTDFFKP